MKNSDSDSNRIAGALSPQEASRLLVESLDLRRPPVTLSFVKSISPDMQGNAPRVAAGCRFWEDAATLSFSTSSADHSLCSIGAYTHNLEVSSPQQTDLNDAIRVFGDLGYVRKEDLASIPVLQFQPRYIVYGPLSETLLPPDVVILFVTTNQMLILCEAAQQVEAQHPPAMGRPACAIVPQVMNTGRAAVSLGCCGARAYLDALTDEMSIFAIPGAKLAAYIERVRVLSEANSVLSEFHRLRRRDVEAGLTPTVMDSLAVLHGN